MLVNLEGVNRVHEICLIGKIIFIQAIAGKIHG